MRILIVDDDGVSRTVLRHAIARNPEHECLVAEDGEQAWSLFLDTDLDVVISDWMMPGIDGIELCRRIRATETDAYPYFIFLTTLEDRAHVQMGLRAGADDYLAKPLDIDDLQVRLIAAARVTSLHRQVTAQKHELERLNAQLYRQARTDALTGLGNRLQMREDLQALHERSERLALGYGLALIDIDHFKAYNDHSGHPAGDAVLRAVAGTIASHCHDGATAYRYGGEEFLILLPEQPLEAATDALDAMRRSVRSLAIPHPGKSPAGLVTISAGVTVFVPGACTTVDSMLADADAALYRAKAAGRDRVVPAGGAAALSAD